MTSQSFSAALVLSPENGTTFCGGNLTVQSKFELSGMFRCIRIETQFSIQVYVLGTDLH
jgi:D-mannonate dehydratase